ncbi:MAG: tetratricopeptide repeat protein, partial [bacterium]
KATELNPRDAEGWEAYGSALLGLGRAPRAQRALRRSTALDPKRASAWLELAQSLAQAQDASPKSLNQAVDACGRAAALQPRDARPLLDEGLFLARLGRDAQALSVLREAVRRNGGQAAYKSLCVLYNKDGNYALAEGACQRAAKDGGSAESWYDLGFALERNGKAAQARGAYDRAVALDPGHAAALYALAFLDFQAGDAGKALQGFRAALAARQGNYPEAEYNVAVLLGDEGHYEQAADLYRGLLRRHPHDADARANLEAMVQAGLSGLLAQGQASYERGDVGAARHFWQRARHLDPANGEAARMLRLIDVRAASSRARAARKAARVAKAEVALRLRAQDEALRKQGLRAFDQGHWRDAEHLLAFYLRNHPNDGALLRTLTEARGREQAAVDELLRQAIAAQA